MSAEKIVNLDPAKILAEDNVRFALLGHRVDAMAESIVERGGIQSPVEVELLSPPANGYTHRLTAGFYRHAGALKLNTESKAGVQVPAIVRTPADAKDRLLRQLSENRDRENMTPMDTAVAIKKLMDAGATKDEVRKVFKIPGGRKGIVLQPASNSYINMHLAMLGLPKAVQTKVADGRLGVLAAWELSKVPKEQQAAILERAEAMRQKGIDRDEREEAKSLREAETEAQKAEREAVKLAKVDEAAKVLEAAEIEKAAALENHQAATVAAKEAKKVGPWEEKFGKAKEEWTEPEMEAFANNLTASKKALRDADKRQSAATKGLDKAQRAYKALTEVKAKTVEEPKAEVEKTTKGKTAGATEIRKAAKEAGVSKEHVQLNIGEARTAVAELAKSRFAKVKAIGQVLQEMLSGKLTTKSAETELTVITGERQTKKA